MHTAIETREATGRAEFQRALIDMLTAALALAVEQAGGVVRIPLTALHDPTRYRERVTSRTDMATKEVVLSTQKG